MIKNAAFMIIYLFKKNILYFSKFYRTIPGYFPVFFFFHDISRPVNLCFHFPGFQGFQVHGNPDNKF